MADTNENAKNIDIWYDGLPSTDLAKNNDDLGTIAYWFNGLPYTQVYPSAAVTARQSDFMPFFWGIG